MTPNLRNASLAIICGLVTACSSHAPKATLADMDFSRAPEKDLQQTQSEQTRAQIVQSYYQYIERAPKNDKMREDAITRLVALEIDNANSGSDTTSLSPDALERANRLLQQSLADYPNSTTKDRSLYQLAQVYEQLGRTQESLAHLKRIISEFPKSAFLAEAHFRLAENAFKDAEYLAAEASYTETLLAPNNGSFSERALYKRAWARYKQGVYRDACEDFVTALRQHAYLDAKQQSESQKAVINELLRGASLAAINLPQDQLQTLVTEDFVWAYEFYEYTAQLQARKNPALGLARMDAFIGQFQSSPRLPLAYLYLVKQHAQQQNAAAFEQALHQLYSRYNPDAPFWQENPNVDKDSVFLGLRKNMAVAAAQGLDANSQSAQLTNAKVWSERYLKHFSAFAQQDKMYKQYAMLLSASEQGEKALDYYEKSAFDGNIILDKDAAYAAIVTNDQLLKKARDAEQLPLLAKMSQYAKAYAQMYPQDAQTPKILLRAAEAHMSAKQFAAVPTLVTPWPNSSNKADQYTAAILKAQAFIALQRFNDAENALLAVYSPSSPQKDTQGLANTLAEVFIQQGQAAEKAASYPAAAAFYAKIVSSAPQAEQAPKALYQAINLSVKHELWGQASAYGQEFQTRFANHEYSADVNRLLSTSYLKSNNQGKAAQALESLAKTENDTSVKASALWQAANLYLAQKDLAAARRAFSDYSTQYPKPFGQYMEALYRLVPLLPQSEQPAILQKMATADSQAALTEKSERTAYLAAWAQLQRGDLALQEYQRIRLVEPLQKSLALKKQALQNALALYTQAGNNNQLDILAQASYQVAFIYQDFAKALLQSERPRHLRGEELEQYTILLEDQAFPFEDKAIEFHQINLGRLKTGTNPWLLKSLESLKQLSPARYQRQAKVAFYE
jgi:cellulose synthase operon protein C